MMIPQSPNGDYIMPTSLQHTLTSEPTGDPWAGFSAAMAFTKSGFRVLPCQPGGKRPLTTRSFSGGARTASGDLERVRDAWLEEPGANVGLAPDGSFFVVDVDPRAGGSLEAVEELGLPVDGYRERSGGGGWHLPFTMPPGLIASRPAVLVPGVEVKARGSYVVSPHSRLEGGGWYSVEPGRHVWTWPVVPVRWPMLDRITREVTTATYALGTITAAHRREACRVVRGLAAAPADTARDAAALMRGDVSTKPSASEADYGLALMASFHTLEPEVIAAVLESSGLRRAKWREHPTYLALTIARALQRRRVLSTQSANLVHHLQIPPAVADSIPKTEPPLRPPVAPTVSYGTFCVGEGKKGGRFGRILDVVAALPNRDLAGFARVPVEELARALNVDRRTVSRDLAELESLRLVETEIRQPAGLRRERWARLAVLEGIKA